MTAFRSLDVLARRRLLAVAAAFFTTLGLAAALPAHAQSKPELLRIGFQKSASLLALQKTQGTLEKRLGESFKQVSDRLEQVHRGLGEAAVVLSLKDDNEEGRLKRQVAQATKMNELIANFAKETYKPFEGIVAKVK